jgi:hypothetical protein
MSVFSLFHSIVQSACDDDVDDPIVAAVRDQLEAHERYNVLYSKQDELLMDENDTQTINLANYGVAYPNDWTIIVLQVEGWVELQTLAKNYDNATTINGYQRSKGTSVFPGLLVLSSYNVTTFTLKALADSTKIRYLAAVACLSTDSRYEDNA